VKFKEKFSESIKAEKDVEKLIELVEYSLQQASRIKRIYKNEGIAVSVDSVIKKAKEIQNILIDMEYESSQV